MYVYAWRVVHAALLAIKQLTIYLEFVFLSFTFIIYIYIYIYHFTSLRQGYQSGSLLKKHHFARHIATCQPTIYAHAIMTKTI